MWGQEEADGEDWGLRDPAAKPAGAQGQASPAQSLAVGGLTAQDGLRDQDSLLRTQCKGHCGSSDCRLSIWMGIIPPPQEHRDITVTCHSRDEGASKSPNGASSLRLPNIWDWSPHGPRAGPQVSPGLVPTWARSCSPLGPGAGLGQAGSFFHAPSQNLLLGLAFFGEDVVSKAHTLKPHIVFFGHEFLKLFFNPPKKQQYYYREERATVLALMTGRELLGRLGQRHIHSQTGPGHGHPEHGGKLPCSTPGRQRRVRGGGRGRRGQVKRANCKFAAGPAAGT